MSSPVDVSAVETRWHPLSASESVVATTLLEDAWALLKRADASIATRLTAETLDLQLLKQVMAAMVLRVLRNPEQVKSRRETVGPFAVSNDMDATGLVVTPDELELLAAPAAAGGAFTISTFVPPT